LTAVIAEAVRVIDGSIVYGSGRWASSRRRVSMCRPSLWASPQWRDFAGKARPRLSRIRGGATCRRTVFPRSSVKVTMPSFFNLGLRVVFRSHCHV